MDASQDQMKISIAEMNVEHFRKLLTTDLDEVRRSTVQRLLSEEEAKLVRLSGKLPNAPPIDQS